MGTLLVPGWTVRRGKFKDVIYYTGVYDYVAAYLQGTEIVSRQVILEVNF